MSTSDTCEIISSNIDIAQNEYVTKYSFNRNFEKLLSNDAILDTYSSSSQIETYNKHKTYSKDQLVLYKIHKTDPNLYLLCSMTTPNMHKPRVRQDFQTNKLYVISSEYWSIVGGIDSDGTQMASKDAADKIVSTNKITFVQNHQENESLNVHPTGKLGMKDSSILFRTFTNISDEKQHFFYPYELRSFVANDSTYSGYMRKWDNGLLEYDIIFRLSYAGKTDDGSDIISANNYHALHQNNNFMYFKTDDDYEVFSRGGEYYANVNGTKQVNLNRTINTYSSKVEFIEPFKDLNYMVFTSNVKNVETEAYNNKIEAIDDYDKRLQINGLTIIGLEPNATFRLELNIPNQIVNIKRHALSDMKKAQGYPIPLTIDPYSSNLVNIDNEAFLRSEIDTISFPYSLRYIGKDAFSGCNSLTSVVFHVERDPNLQPKIDYNAFNDTNIQSISVIYKTDALMMFRSSADETDQPYRDLMYNNDDNLHTKFNNTNYRTNVGIHGVPTIYVENAPDSRTLMAHFKSIDDTVLSNDIERDVVSTEVSSETQMITIDVNEFLAELSAMKQSKLMSSTLLRANVPPVITEDTLFEISDGIIIGFNDDIVLSDAIEFDISESSKIRGIGSHALVDAHKLTSLSIGENISNIAPDAFGSFNKLFINKVGNDLNLVSSSFNTLCIENHNNKSISVDRVENFFYLAGNIPAYAISANSINNLYVNNAHTLYPSAFWNVEHIENAYLNSNNSTAVLSSSVFRYFIYNEYYDETKETIIDSWYKCNVEKLNLQGTDWTLGPSSLIGFDVDYLSVNIHNGYIASNAICSSDINMFKIYDLLNANTNTGYRGIYSHAFNSSYIANIKFPDITSNISALSSVLRKSDSVVATSAALTSIGILTSSPMIITTANDTKIFYNNVLTNKPPYLCIDSTNTTLTSITTEIAKDKYDGQVLIPNYITTIGNNDKLTKDESSIGSIINITVPNSVTSIKNNAFSGLSALERIVFEPGIQLSSIGLNIFEGCINLKDVVFP